MDTDICSRENLELNGFFTVDQYIGHHSHRIYLQLISMSEVLRKTLSTRRLLTVIWSLYRTYKLLSPTSVESQAFSTMSSCPCNAVVWHVMQQIVGISRTYCNSIETIQK